MSDKMELIKFENLIKWIFEEYSNSKTIFGIHESHFYKHNLNKSYYRFNEMMDTPLGPAAGPHTQLTQNIIASFLVGSRFFELKTVQILDELEIDKPCIFAQDEGYNIEWSQELKLEESFDEYLKAWLLLPLIDNVFNLNSNGKAKYIFNMSVGYNLEGIKSERVNAFIEKLKDANLSPLFARYKSELINSINAGYLNKALKEKHGFTETKLFEIKCLVESVSAHISNSMTLSTMHGCPSDEIEAISNYLIEEKKLHTYVKLNPTLLGYEKVKTIFEKTGFDYIELDASSFEHDLKFEDAVPMINRLKAKANEHNLEFGIKLSNTLGVKNKSKDLKSNEKYMSGRSLFPLTINLADKISNALHGEINISFSGGAQTSNINDILATGIYPVTVATDILKPGGLIRMKEMSDLVLKNNYSLESGKNILLDKLADLAQASLSSKKYRKSTREFESIKLTSKLELFDCYVAPCQQACPIHQDVAEYISLIEQERFVEAIEVITAKNPLPNITGYICDHKCMNHCTRWDYEQTLDIREIKKVAAEKGLAKFSELLKPNINSKESDSKVAVVGAGPAGLSAAYFLARAGIPVKIFERNDSPGGVAQYSIPRFRLPQEAVDADINFIKLFGVEFEFGVNENFSITQLKKLGYKYVFVAIGASTTSPLQLEGMSNPTISAIKFLEDFNIGIKPKLGKNVAVIGAGNSAMDAARAAGKIDGVENSFIVYRRTREFMPADKDEIDGALEDGVKFHELLQPIAYDGKILKCSKMRLSVRDADGRRKVIPMGNEFEELEIDSVISAVGEKVDTAILSDNGLFDLQENRMLAEISGQTNNFEEVFLGGDALRGPGNLIDAVADGKNIAERIISEEGYNKNIDENFDRFLPPKELSQNLLRKKGIVEYQSKNIIEEASRCLGCNFECNKCVDVCPNRANIALELPNSETDFKDPAQILHIDGMCNECGNCETFCPHSGKPYVHKITLFWKEEEFYNSQNDGFLLVNEKAESFTYLIRFKGEVDDIVISKSFNSANLAGSDKKDKEFKQFVKMILATQLDHNYLIQR